MTTFDNPTGLRKGAAVRVTASHSGHQFEIGDVVYLVKEDDNSFSPDPKETSVVTDHSWWLEEDEYVVVEEAPEPTPDVPQETIVLEELSALDYLRLPKRSFDLVKGDRRFHDLKRAVDHADRTSAATGIRQVVRRDVDVLNETMYVVQALGS